MNDIDGKRNSKILKTQPAEKIVHFISSKKTRPLIFLIAFMLITGVIAYIKHQVTPQQAGSSSSEVVIQAPDYTQEQFAANHNGNTIAIRYKNTNILVRSQYDYSSYIAWKDWLIFASTDFKNDKWNAYEKIHPIQLHGYNFVTHEYVTLGSFNPKDAGDGLSLMKVNGKYLYIYASGYKTKAVTYRCLLSLRTACSEPKLVYYGDGLILQRKNSYFAMDATGDAGVFWAAVYSFDPVTKTTKKVITTDSTNYVGNTFLGIDDQGRTWVMRFSGDPNSENTDKLTLVKIYAVDKTGKTVATIQPSRIPLTKVSDVRTESYDITDSFDKLIIKNSKNYVTYDVTTGKFSEKMSNTPTEDNAQNAETTKADLQKYLPLPDGYRYAIGACFKDYNEGSCDYTPEY